MTWFKVDDKAHDHRKVRSRSLAAVGLWTLAGAWSSDNRTDGFVPDSVARRWPSHRKLAAELVEAGLWEEAEVDGERGWRFHDWSDWQPTRDDTNTPTAHLRWRRQKALQRNRPLCEDIVARDRNRCRYCGERVNWTDRKGRRGGTYDHIDPDGPNTLDNVVVACRACNGQKRDRTPDEAGMTLLPPPDPDAIQNGSGLRLDPSQNGTGPINGADLAPRARRTRDGTGQVGTGSGSGRAGSERAKSGRAGHRPGGQIDTSERESP